jgi:hypothetical protein
MIHFIDHLHARPLIDLIHLALKLHLAYSIGKWGVQALEVGLKKLQQDLKSRGIL